MSTLALFGGSFDPPHVGHVLAAAWVLSTQDVEAVRVVPAYDHAFDKRLTPFEHRLKMAEIAFGALRDVEVSDVERELGGESYTIRTVEHFLETEPLLAWRLMIGSDLVPQLPDWERGAELVELAPPLVVGRGGHTDGTEDIAMPNVSSTEVRRRLTAGAPVDHLVPRAVAIYVEAHGLYR